MWPFDIPEKRRKQRADTAITLAELHGMKYKTGEQIAEMDGGDDSEVKTGGFWIVISHTKTATNWHRYPTLAAAAIAYCELHGIEV